MNTFINNKFNKKKVMFIIGTTGTPLSSCCSDYENHFFLVELVGGDESNSFSHT
uniref:Uncharacterized protein n=1 Tax=Solanum lycopersicum TaxID=4081 RepID=A0A3Q7E9W7_SOLLC